MSESKHPDREGDSPTCARYQGYVIRVRQYIGRFEEIYCNTAEVPWHQDEAVSAIFSDLALGYPEASPDSQSP